MFRNMDHTVQLAARGAGTAPQVAQLFQPHLRGAIRPSRPTPFEPALDQSVEKIVEFVAHVTVDDAPDGPHRRLNRFMPRNDSFITLNN
ncbi:hypothetical protein GCM10007291_20500 [Gemmobacter nanjingensis]|uniref:Uncharacterized protein n=1 Tax=Gemmobacter nanjingensis TaxID=488454 RepID=A0ABQ3FFL2_9RHOB|nr:hypothetical protein GCM10007291_20500 [Gemmobacter nanjingensis]